MLSTTMSPVVAAPLLRAALLARAPIMLQGAFLHATLQGTSVLPHVHEAASAAAAASAVVVAAQTRSAGIGPAVPVSAAESVVWERYRLVQASAERVALIFTHHNPAVSHNHPRLFLFFALIGPLNIHIHTHGKFSFFYSDMFLFFPSLQARPKSATT